MCFCMYVCVEMTGYSASKGASEARPRFPECIWVVSHPILEYIIDAINDNMINKKTKKQSAKQNKTT